MSADVRQDEREKRGRLTWEKGEFHAVSLADKVLPAIGQGAIALQAKAARREVIVLVDLLDLPV